MTWIEPKKYPGGLEFQEIQLSQKTIRSGVSAGYGRR
jgi:hypothetical protein